MNNDVLLVPITVEQPNVEAQSDIVVYVPQAHKKKAGIVKEGDGILVENGVVSLDKTLVQDMVDAVDAVLTDEIMDVDDKIVAHINDFENPHRVTKEQIGLSNVNNTSDLDKPISSATKLELDKINEILIGVNKGVAYSTYKEMVGVLNSAQKTEFFVGQSIFIGSQNVPDLWVYGVESTSQHYDYIDDESIIDAIETDGFVRIGYYKISALETQKTIVGNYVTLDTPQTITAWKEFEINGTYESLILDHDSINKKIYLKYTDDTHGGNYNEISIHQGTANISSSKSLNLDVQSGSKASFNKDINLTTNRDNQNYSYLQISDDNIQLRNENFGYLNINDDNIELRRKGEYLVIDDDGVFVNGSEVATQYDMQKYANENLVSFASSQNLTDYDKQTARNNIGANDYKNLDNKPSINGVELVGDKTASEFGIIDKNVDDLVNYYNKNKTYSKDEVDDIAFEISTESKNELDALKNTLSRNYVTTETEQSIIGDKYFYGKANFYGATKLNGKDVATVDDVDNNFISYTSQQTLTEEQKQIARDNIGAGTGNGGSIDLSNYVTLNTNQTITGLKSVNYNGKNGQFIFAADPVEPYIIMKNSAGDGFSFDSVFGWLMLDSTLGFQATTSDKRSYFFTGTSSGEDGITSFRATSASDDTIESVFKLIPEGAFYNDKEIATKDDIEQAITTTLNTVV